MEFWGIEVEAGKSQKVSVDEGTVIHLSQASFGEIKKGKGGETVPLFVEINGKKLVIGHLSAEKTPCQSFDLVFDKDFELFHESKNGSVFFTGYSSEIPDEEVEHFGDSDSEEDEPQLIPAENGKPEPKVETAKPQPKKDSKPMEADESDDDSEDDSDGDDSDDEDNSEDSEESEEEETPKKVEVKAELSKKRAVESPKNTPVPAKKAKGGASPSGGKKGGTPHPAKQAGKSPAAQNSGGKNSNKKGKGKHGGK